MGCKRILFLILLVIVFANCNSPESSLEDRVAEIYDRYMVVIDAGVSGILTITLENNEVSGVVSQPTDEDYTFFFERFTENPLCQDCDGKDEIVACIISELRKRGCVKIATCATCIYSCE